MKPSKSKHSKSKRMALGMKYKVQKKVREAHKKQNKIDKVMRLRGKTKKDPGIPNLHPFKERMIRLEEERRVKEEQAVAARKALALKQKKGGSLADMAAAAAQRTAEYEATQAMEAGDASTDTITDVSRRAYYKEFRKVVDAADVILEVLDARDPMGCRCRRVEQQILAAGSDKRLVLVLNKIDLVPKSVLEKWMVYLRNEFPVLAFKASTQEKTSKIGVSRNAASGGHSMGASVCFGAPALMSLLGNYCRNLDIKTAIRVGVVGYPNVGKSSLINSLKRGRVCGVGAQPGFTTTCQEIVLDKHIKLIDSPGIVFDVTGTGSDFALRNCVKVDDLEDPVTPVGTILARCDHDIILEKYSVPEFDTTEEFLQHLSRRFGKLKKGGIPDIKGAARSVLNDWNCGKISFYTVPPETHTMPTHVAASFAASWGADFDLDQVDGMQDTGMDAVCAQEEATSLVMGASDIPDDPVSEGDDEGDDEDADEGGEGAEGEMSEDEDASAGPVGGAYDFGAALT